MEREREIQNTVDEKLSKQTGKTENSHHLSHFILFFKFKPYSYSGIFCSSCCWLTYHASTTGFPKPWPWRATGCAGFCFNPSLTYLLNKINSSWSSVWLWTIISCISCVGAGLERKPAPLIDLQELEISRVGDPCSTVLLDYLCNTNGLRPTSEPLTNGFKTTTAIEEQLGTKSQYKCFFPPFKCFSSKNVVALIVQSF